MSSEEQPTHTAGRVIHWAGFYDLLLKVMTLGREGRFRSRIITTAKLEEGQRVLDVGCGTGTLAIAAAEVVGSSGKVRGIDPAPEMISRARSKAAKAGAAVQFDVGVIEALDIPDQSIDVVLSTLMFHHLPPDIQTAGLAEIRRVLVPSGRLVLVDFGKPEHLAPEVKAAGFDAVRTARMKPRFLFSLVATDGS